MTRGVIPNTDPVPPSGIADMHKGAAHIRIRKIDPTRERRVRCPQSQRGVHPDISGTARKTQRAAHCPAGPGVCGVHRSQDAIVRTRGIERAQGVRVAAAVPDPLEVIGPRGAVGRAGQLGAVIAPCSPDGAGAVAGHGWNLHPDVGGLTGVRVPPLDLVTETRV